MGLKVNLEKAIANTSDEIESGSFCQQAERNLEQTREQKRNSTFII